MPGKKKHINGADLTSLPRVNSGAIEFRHQGNSSDSPPDAGSPPLSLALNVSLSEDNFQRQFAPPGSNIAAQRLAASARRSALLAG